MSCYNGRTTKLGQRRPADGPASGCLDMEVKGFVTVDSLTVAALCRELNTLLQGARIDKIHQPSDRDVVLTVRSRTGNHRLLLSANRAQPRAHLLYAARPVNPEEPPMFCMLLRKRIEGGRIAHVRQWAMDRIVSIRVETINELGDPTAYDLRLEIMGKHSNLMLTELDAAGAPGRIVDSLIHVSPDVSRVRPILPGFQYVPVPAQDKTTIPDVTGRILEPLAIQDFSAMNQAKAVTRHVAGVGPITAREALFRANSKGESQSPAQLADDIASQLQQLWRAAETGDEASALLLDTLGRPVGAVPFRPTHASQWATSESLNQALDALYQASLEIAQQSKLASELTRVVRDTMDKLRGKLTKIAAQLEASQDIDDPRIRGELLTTYGYQVTKGQTHVELPNYYENETPLRIDLDPALSPMENAQRYFKMSSKRKRAIPILTIERDKTEADLTYLDAVLVHLTDASPSILQEIEAELQRQGFLTSRIRRKSDRANKKRSSTTRRDAGSVPDLFHSVDGFPMRVGRNNLQNDRLTLKSSQPQDVWLHVKDQPGSHVVIQTDKKAVPESTLHEAALLAAYFSKGRDSTNVAVDYTLIRNVWKPNGARPGHVLYEGQRTLFVSPERSQVLNILQRPGG